MRQAGPQKGLRRRLLRTDVVTVSTYPTTASAFFACLPTDIDGNEAEGASATYVQESSTVFYAWNAGTQVPPVGTAIVCHAVGGRWVFRYDA